MAARRAEVGANPALVLALVVAALWPVAATTIHHIDTAAIALRATMTTVLTGWAIVVVWALWSMAVITR